MTPLYPLTFRPVLKRYIWGGRRLGELLGKPLGEGTDYAESWEVADHPQGQSVVANGQVAGTTLHELVTTRGDDLLGQHAPQNRFPLIFKLLDAQKDLSVQVHPNDEQAERLVGPGQYGKTEAWHFLDVEHGTSILAGVKPGTTPTALAAGIRTGRILDVAQRLEVFAGETYLIPAGTLHALGPGLLLYEVQQASDTTYRLFDSATGAYQTLDPNIGIRGPAESDPRQMIWNSGEHERLRPVPGQLDERAARTLVRPGDLHPLGIVARVSEFEPCLGRWPILRAPPGCANRLHRIRRRLQP
jgi:hypothetical protein